MPQESDQNTPALQPTQLEATVQELELEVERLERIEVRSASVMVVDDMQTMRLLITQSLRGAGFEEIHGAADGESALTMMRRLNTDLAIVDWNMPRMDGLELLDRVRSTPGLKAMVYIMVTAETLDARVIQAAEEQQDAYLTKPISPDKLARRLDLILEKRMATARSRLYEARGQVDLAVDTFISALHNHPSARWPLFGLGEVLFRSGRWRDAEKPYYRILELDPSALAAKVELGRVKEAQGDIAAGRELYLEAIRQNPQLFRAYDALADSLHREGDLEGALQVVHGAMQYQGTENAHRQFMLGRLHQGLGNHLEAEAAFKKTIALKPLRDRVANRMALGQSRMAQNRLDEAIADFQRAYDPADQPGEERARLDAMLLTGQAYLRKGADGYAEHEFNRMHSAQSWPERKVPFEAKQLHRETGGVYLCEGRDGKARQQFMYSVLSDGRDPDNLLAIREICQEMGRDDLAEEDFGDLESARAASLVEAHSRRGLVLVSRGQLAEAEAEYLQGLAIDQDSARLRYNLGKLRYRLKRYEEGSADILQAARSGIASGDWELVAEVARFFAASGQPERGLTILRQILAKLPGQPILQKALTELEQD